MNTFEDDRYRLMSPWSYIRLSILYSIPVIGWIFMIVFSFSSNINRRNFTRSYWYRVFAFIGICLILYYTYPEFIPRNITKTLDSIQSSITNTLSGLKIISTSETSTPVATNKTLVQTSEATTKLSAGAGVTPSFKEAMDSYEAFFNDYIDFFKRYSEADNPLLMVSDYVKFMSQYTEMIEKMEAMDDDELSVADAAYYLEVTARIYKRLGEAI